MSRSVYLETSALLRSILGQEGGAAVAEDLASAHKVVTSRLTQVEADRALIRMSLDFPNAEGEISRVRGELAEIWAGIDFLDLSDRICEVARRIAPSSRLRSLDAIHLASFVQAREADPRLELLTFDDRLRAAVLGRP